MNPTWNHRYAMVNGVRLHYVEAGAGPPVVLLHGFPEFWYSWRQQIPALTAAGFRVIALDQRGYNESDKPPGVQHYRLELLVRDVVDIVRHAGVERAHIVGHDWGGAIAWQVAIEHPEVVDRLAILNAPHPAALERELRGPRQWLRSWYILFFQLPWLPEWLWQRGDQRLIERVFSEEPVRRDAFTAEDIAHYKRAFGQPGALTAAINYYRAALRHRSRMTRRLRQIPASTLLIWGERDRYLGLRLSEGLTPWVPNLRVVRLPEASHWVQNDAPERVNELLVEFLGER